MATLRSERSVANSGGTELLVVEFQRTARNPTREEGRSALNMLNDGSCGELITTNTIIKKNNRKTERERVQCE